MRKRDDILADAASPENRNLLRLVLLYAVTLGIWLILVMVYSEHYFPPLQKIEQLLMPWRTPLPLEGGLDQRLSFMQRQLDAAAYVSTYALVAMVVFFAALSIYLSIVYQQKQRRARENLFLTLKNQEIARRNEFIRYISATIGHEFKNNLGRIKRRIDLLPGLDTEARMRIGSNLEKLFADIDIFKKISDEREAGLVEFKKINLRAVLEDLVSQYADLAEMSIEESVAAPYIYAAPPLLKTVFENVIDNAIKYRKPEQIRARVRVSCAMDSDGSRRYVTLSIRDEGRGMNEEQADACFYKGKGSGESWGQGLYFAKYVIGLHAGRIRIGKEYTAAGRGAEIIINLPFVEEALGV